MGKTAEVAADRSGGTGRDPSGRRSGWRYAAEETTESGVVDTEFRGGGTETEFRMVATETEDGFAHGGGGDPNAWRKSGRRWQTRLGPRDQRRVVEPTGRRRGGLNVKWTKPNYRRRKRSCPGPMAIGGAVRSAVRGGGLFGGQKIEIHFFPYNPILFEN